MNEGLEGHLTQQRHHLIIGHVRGNSVALTINTRDFGMGIRIRCAGSFLDIDPWESRPSKMQCHDGTMPPATFL